MRKIDGPGNVSGAFADYDPVTNPNGTVVTADWANDVQDELLAIQNDQDIAETAGTNAGVLQALVKKIENEQLFDLVKSDYESVSFSKGGVFTVTTSQKIWAQTSAGLLAFASGTSVTMPSGPAVGTDFAIWATPSGTLEADASHSTPPEFGATKIGGFHYAPGGNATLDSGGNWANHTGGDTTPQINEYSFWDLKWRPSVDDPRGLALVPGLNEWWGIYPMSNGNEGVSLHMYGVSPCRETNDPYKMWADTPAAYTDATPMNIFELLAYYGFRPPSVYNFQFAALGTTEETSAGGTDPGLTGELGTTQNKERFTSAWGLFDITGVISAWGEDTLMATTDTLGVTQGRSNEIFRASRFAYLGGSWSIAALSGSRYVDAASSSGSSTGIGGRGVCDHLILV